MPGWTWKQVELLFAEAVETLRRLPSDRPKGFKSSMPDVVRNMAEAFGYDDVVIRLGPPSAAAIDRLDLVLSLNTRLDDREVKIVWARALPKPVPFRVLGAMFHLKKSQAAARYMVALLKLVQYLNEKKLPLPRQAA